MSMSQSNKGFILIDSLMTVFIVSCICILCFSIYKSIENYIEGYLRYTEESNIRYEEIYNNLPECEVCEIYEYDQDD